MKSPEKFKQIFSDLPEYDEEDSFDQDSAYDEAKQVADWFQQGLQTSDNEPNQRQTEEIEQDWQQCILEMGNNGVVEFRDIVKSIPRNANFDDVRQMLCRLQEMKVNVIFSSSHWREKTFLMKELAKLAWSCEHNVRLFLDKISHYPFLKKKEEWVLIFLAQHGNIEARNRVVQSYMQYVSNLAKHYVDSGLPFMDLIQEGCLGIIKAIGRYDPSQLSRLYHYAHWWVKQKIRRAISNQSRLIRIPVYFEDQMETVKQARQQIENRLEREATTFEIAEALDIDKDKVEEIISWMNASFIRLSEISEDDERYCKICMDESYSEIEDRLEWEFLREQIKTFLETREWKILNWRLGLENGKSPETLASIGEKLNLSRERVRQIESEIFDKLSKPFSPLWKFYHDEPIEEENQLSENNKDQTSLTFEIAENSKKKDYSKKAGSKPIESTNHKIESWNERQKKHEEEVQLVFEWFMENVDEK